MWQQGASHPLNDKCQGQAQQQRAFQLAHPPPGHPQTPLTASHRPLAAPGTHQGLPAGPQLSPALHQAVKVEPESPDRPAPHTGQPSLPHHALRPSLPATHDASAAAAASPAPRAALKRKASPCSPQQPAREPVHAPSLHRGSMGCATSSQEDSDVEILTPPQPGGQPGPATSQQECLTTPAGADEVCLCY